MKTWMTGGVLAALAWCGAWPVAAAETTNAVNATVVRISPAAVVSNALAYSRQLSLADAEIQAAQARLQGARAQALPQLTVDARAAHYDGLRASVFGPLFVIPEIENRYGAGVGVSQPLYTGGRVSGQKTGAAHLRQAAEETRRGTENDLASQALATYWTWSKAYYAMESLRAAVARMEAHDRDMRNLKEAGLATDNDALATEVLLEQTRLREETARRAVELSLANLAFLTGRSLPPGCLPEAPAEMAAPLSPAEEELVRVARESRGDRSARASEIEAAQAQVKVSRAEARPQVSLAARYETARPNLMNIPPLDVWQDDAFVGVTVNWSLFDFGRTKAKVAEARARSEQARLRLEQLDDQIQLEVRRAVINLRESRERLAVATRVQRSAQRNLEVATDLWQGGLTRHSDVLDAHSQLTDAQFQVVAARADLMLARTELDRATGRLTDSR